jgi:hypothetical protein
MVVVVLGTESSTTPKHSLTEAKGTQQAAIPTLKGRRRRGLSEESSAAVWTSHGWPIVGRWLSLGTWVHVCKLYVSVAFSKGLGSTGLG